jgi:uncharacterized protein YfaS (alpha-2-macroglobulin family)
MITTSARRWLSSMLPFDARRHDRVAPRPCSVFPPAVRSYATGMRSHSRANSAIFLSCVMLWGTLAASCRGSQKPPKDKSTTAVGQTRVDQVLVQLEDAPPGLAVRLSEGKLGIDRAADRVRLAPAVVLSEPAAGRLLDRMPKLVGEADDKKDFAVREKSLPPPQTGNTLKGTFPPPPTKAPRPDVVVAGTELKVQRFAPEGEVPVAPHLAITFNQPMVAITSHADSIAHGVPVTLTPEPKGTWRWIGSKTLMFDPDVRFPAATEYKVDIAQGTKSASGAVLKKAVSFKFATPPPQVTQSWPTSGPQRRDPVLFVSFDQKIDRDAVLATIAMRHHGSSTPVRLATAEEIAKDPVVKSLVEAEDKSEHAGRYLAFKPSQLLPADTEIEVAVGPGTPSAEGPRKTSAPHGFGFRTFGPLKIVEWHCSWAPQCPPGTPFTIRFTNPLDPEKFDPETLAIEPKLPGMKAVASGEWLTIYGRQRGRTTYRVTVPASVEDMFEQTLGKPDTMSFTVGDAYPQLFGPGGLTLLDPSAKKPTYDFHSINIPSVDVQVWQVEPADWPGFIRYMEKNPRNPKSPPGKRVINKTLKIAGSPDEMVETHIDLSPALRKNGKGHAVVVVTPTRWPDRWKPMLDAWVQSTAIAVDAFVDADELLGWATRLSDGMPLSGVELALEPKTARATTGARGTAVLKTPRTVKQGTLQMLTARQGDDVAFMPENTYYWSDYGGWRRQETEKQLAWFVYDDRGMYRPGEKVSLKGWMRVVDFGEGGDVAGLGGAVDSVSYTVTGPRGNEITKGTAKVNPLGGFDARFELPKTPNLGYASIHFVARGKRGGAYDHNFQIQEFRRPEYEVTATASEGPHLVGASADITVKAQYYAGGGLANADVNWQVRSTPASFTPPGRDEFTFGTWSPWWSHRWDAPDESRYDSFQGKTDASGQHILHVDFLSIKPPKPMSLVAEGYVMDVNRQQWAASTVLLVHPSALYVGLKQDRYFVDQGVPIEVQAIAVDHDGKSAVGTAIDMKAVRLDWSYKKGEWKEEEADPQACAARAAEAPQTCKFETPEGGTYRITATVSDKAGRPNQTQIMVWVSGGDVPPVRNVEQQEVTLVPDAKEYRPGQTAKLLVQAPFFPAHGLLTLRRSGITESRSFELKGPTTTLEVPIGEGHVPNVYVQVDVVGSATRVDDDGKPDDKLPRRPAYGMGTVNLPVPPVTRTLQVSVKPQASKIEPGGSTRVEVVVRDALGKPMPGAEMSVVVVDEAVLALTGYQTPNPLAAFYPERQPGATDYHIRQYVTLARPDLGSLAAGAPGGGDAAQATSPAAPPSAEPSAAMSGASADMESSGGGRGALAQRPMKKGKMALDETKEEANGNASPNTPIAVRKDFGALAVFAPEVKTDASGKASIAVKVPDSLTRYRVMVAAVAGEKQFGSGEANITARMPLMVRPSPPRFLNFGDRFELPVVLQNQTDRAMVVDVGVRATNANVTDGHGRQLTVPANDRVEVRFPAAAEMAGTARFQFAAQSGRFADAAELSLPVWTPATSEAFAVYGEIDKGAVRQKVSMPRDVWPQFGGLEITTSSTQLQALTDAVLYLIAYPYECAEQLSSRVLAVAALRDVLGAFKAEGLPKPAEIEAAVARDLERLKGMQNGDGGFAFWVRGYESWPYISIHVGHALARAKEKGYAVPAGMIERNKSYLVNIEQHLPWYYSPDVKRALRAYALYVLKRLGDVDIAKANGIIKEAGGVEKLGMETLGWLMYTMSGDKGSAGTLSAMHRHLDNKVTETAGTAHWVTGYSDGAHLLLHSDRRADGILLEAIIEDRPKSDVIPKVVRGLLAHRVQGHWTNTQENAFVLLAMDRYFHVYEKVTPDFVSRAWLGDTYAGEHAFKGRQTDKHHIDVPMSFLAAQAKKGNASQDLILQKDGKGRLYYRVGMSYAPSSLWLEPDDHGFAVERTYEAVDKPTDVVRQKDGSWKIKAGAAVRVRLTMVAEARRYHVALVDPLPAGLEPMNPALAVTGTIPMDPKAQKEDPWWFWTRTWYEHQNMRDERVEAFTSLLWEGVHEYTYVARATTPGNFVVPPTKAEEMYMPETFGRSASDRVIVE